MKRAALVALLLTSLLLGACSTGPVRRVSEPSAGIQQLSVRADGSWSLDLRLDNFSNVPMRFDAVDLAMTIAGQPPTTLRTSPGFTIGPESADVATLQLVPTAGARIAIADALARGAAIAYELEGTITATPENGKQRVFELGRDNALAPVPGLPGVLR
ncbi:MAG: LEA type 2 family protein [Pseudomonadota bacterium]|nr:LEA type 2 family protein [Pseudomonadota bacterium]